MLAMPWRNGETIMLLVALPCLPLPGAVPAFHHRLPWLNRLKVGVFEGYIAINAIMTGCIGLIPSLAAGAFDQLGAAWFCFGGP